MRSLFDFFEIEKAYIIKATQQFEVTMSIYLSLQQKILVKYSMEYFEVEEGLT